MRDALSRCVGKWEGLRRCHCAEAVCGTEALLPSPDVDANEPHGSSFADTSTNSHKLGRATELAFKKHLLLKFPFTRIASANPCSIKACNMLH